MTQKLPRGTVPPLMEALGISRRRTQEMLKAGMPPDVSGAIQWRKAQGLGTGTADELRRERVLLVRAQRERCEIENAARRGELVPARESFEAGMMLGHELKSQMMKFISDCVPQVEGLPCIQIYRVLKDGLHRILCHMSSNAYNSPELEALIEDFRKTRPENWIPPNKVTKP